MSSNMIERPLSLDDVERQWRALIYLSSCICQTTHENLCRLNETQQIVVISLLEGLKDPEITRSLYISEYSVRQAIRAIGIKLEIIQEDERNNNIRVLIAKKLSFFSALEHYPQADNLIDEFPGKQNVRPGAPVQVELNGEYSSLNRYVLTAILLLKQLSTKCHIKI